MSSYRTIVADPPWHYDGFPTLLGEGPRSDGQRRKMHSERRPLPYPSMTVDEISALDIPAAPTAHLFLWTTNRYLPDAFRVMEAWEFTYTQTLVWLKERHAPFVASVAPNHCEYLLVGRRGDLRWAGSLPSNVIEIASSPNAKARAHSRKPEAFLDHIENISPGPYLEMFSRRARLGWDTWGDEALHGTEAISR